MKALNDSLLTENTKRDSLSFEMVFPKVFNKINATIFTKVFC